MSAPIASPRPSSSHSRSRSTASIAGFPPQSPPSFIPDRPRRCPSRNGDRPTSSPSSDPTPPPPISIPAISPSMEKPSPMSPFSDWEAYVVSQAATWEDHKVRSQQRAPGSGRIVWADQVQRPVISGLTSPSAGSLPYIKTKDLTSISADRRSIDASKAATSQPIILSSRPTDGVASTQRTRNAIYIPASDPMSSPPASVRSASSSSIALSSSSVFSKQDSKDSPPGLPKPKAERYIHYGSSRRNSIPSNYSHQSFADSPYGDVLSPSEPPLRVETRSSSALNPPESVGLWSSSTDQMVGSPKPLVASQPTFLQQFELDEESESEYSHASGPDEDESDGQESVLNEAVLQRVSIPLVRDDDRIDLFGNKDSGINISTVSFHDEVEEPLEKKDNGIDISALAFEDGKNSLTSPRTTIRPLLIKKTFSSKRNKEEQSPVSLSRQSTPTSDRGRRPLISSPILSSPDVVTRGSSIKAPASPLASAPIVRQASSPHSPVGQMQKPRTASISSNYSTGRRSRRGYDLLQEGADIPDIPPLNLRPRDGENRLSTGESLTEPATSIDSHTSLLPSPSISLSSSTTTTVPQRGESPSGSSKSLERPREGSIVSHTSSLSKVEGSPGSAAMESTLKEGSQSEAPAPPVSLAPASKDGVSPKEVKLPSTASEAADSSALPTHALTDTRSGPVLMDRTTQAENERKILMASYDELEVARFLSSFGKNIRSVRSNGLLDASSIGEVEWPSREQLGSTSAYYIAYFSSFLGWLSSSNAAQLYSPGNHEGPSSGGHKARKDSDEGKSAEFSLSSIRNNSERLYLGAVPMYESLGRALKHVWRWDSPVLTGAFASIYFLCWARGLLIPLFFASCVLYILKLKVSPPEPGALRKAFLQRTKRLEVVKEINERLTKGEENEILDNAHGLHASFDVRKGSTTQSLASEAIRKYGSQANSFIGSMADAHEKVKNVALWRSTPTSLNGIFALSLLGLSSCFLTPWMIARIPGLILGLSLFVIAPVAEHHPDWLPSTDTLHGFIGGIPNDAQYAMLLLRKKAANGERISIDEALLVGDGNPEVRSDLFREELNLLKKTCMDGSYLARHNGRTGLLVVSPTRVFFRAFASASGQPPSTEEL
ncbi:hypothetical protein IE53DRAFT_386419, partial [Violaceomyces palustris]